MDNILIHFCEQNTTHFIHKKQWNFSIFQSHHEQKVIFYKKIDRIPLQYFTAENKA